MRENKQIFYWSVLLSILSLVLATVIEINLPVKRYIVEIFPVVSGHGDFAIDICLGIFTGGIMSIATSYIQYKNSLQNLVKNLIIAYGVRYINVSKIQREEMDHEQLKTLKNQLEEVNIYIEEFSKGFAPFFKGSSRNQKYNEICAVAFDFYMILAGIADAGTSCKGEKNTKIYIDSAVKQCNAKLAEKYAEATVLNKWIEENLGYKI